MSVELTDFAASFVTDKVAVLFKDQPTLGAIKGARFILDQIADDIIREKLNESTP